MTKQITLCGRVFITFDVKAATGLHIGGSDGGIEIGGVDKTVIRDRLTNRPYVPGSSLKGKARSLLEKYKGLKQNQRIGSGYIHSCGAEHRDKTSAAKDYAGCIICQIFGVPGERDFATPTRLVVRDVMMTEASAEQLEKLGRTDLPFTEVKTEVSIDRVTSAANPRSMERVPAGTIFGTAELVYSIYQRDGCDASADVTRLATLVEGLVLLEDDYLGGLGSRGSGQVKLESFKVKWRGKDGLTQPAATLGEFDDLPKLVQGLGAVQATLQEAVRHALAQP